MEPPVNRQYIFDENFVPLPGWRVYRLPLAGRATEMRSGAVKVESVPVRNDFLTIPEIADRWRIARPTVYNRLKDAGVRVLDFAPKGARGRKIVPFGAILEIERRQVRRH